MQLIDLGRTVEYIDIDVSKIPYLLPVLVGVVLDVGPALLVGLLLKLST